MTGKCVKSTDDPVLSAASERYDSMVISWMIHSLEPDIQKSVLYCKTSAEIWKELNERYATANGPRIFQVQKEIYEMIQDTDSVSVYFTKLKTTWDEYYSMVNIPTCSCGSGSAFMKLLQEQQVMKFLMGLNDNYTSARGNILMIQPIPTLNQAYRLILQDEKQREMQAVTNFSPDVAALVSSYNKRPFNSQNSKQFNGQFGQGNGSTSQSP